MPVELVIIKVLRGVVEVAGWFMLGQGLLWILAGRKRNDNFVYQLFAILTRPIFRATRAITPRMVRDEHIPLAAFFLLFWIWVALGLAQLRV